MVNWLEPILRCSKFNSFEIVNKWFNSNFRKVPVWYPKLDQIGEVRSIVCCCTQEEKINFEGFTQNGCYGNQPQPFEALFCSINTNSSCSFTKQDLTVI